MKRSFVCLGLLAGTVTAPAASFAGQVPRAFSDADIPISRTDRVYAAEQFSNTVSVIDPSTNTLLGLIKLGDPQPSSLSPLYKGQILVHGMGFSPARSPNARHRLDRVQRGDFHRYGYECGQAHDLHRPLAA